VDLQADDVGDGLEVSRERRTWDGEGIQCDNLGLMSKALEETEGPIVGICSRKVAQIDSVAGKIKAFERGKVEGRSETRWRGLRGEGQSSEFRQDGRDWLNRDGPIFAVKFQDTFIHLEE
jgi:hypothetical protein